MSDETLVWDVRLFIYKTLTDTERAPTAAEVAAHFGIATEDAQRLLRDLHDRHAIFLDPTSNSYYVLVSGRWFRAGQVAGPWSYVPGEQLPADFARIPPDDPKAAALASSRCPSR